MACAPEPGLRNRIEGFVQATREMPRAVIRNFILAYADNPDFDDPGLDLRPLLPTLQLPTLVLHGEEDRLASVEGGEEAIHYVGAQHVGHPIMGESGHHGADDAAGRVLPVKQEQSNHIADHQTDYRYRRRPGRIDHRLEQLDGFKEQRKRGTAADDFLLTFLREILYVHRDPPFREGSYLLTILLMKIAQKPLRTRRIFFLQCETLLPQPIHSKCVTPE